MWPLNKKYLNKWKNILTAKKNEIITKWETFFTHAYYLWSQIFVLNFHGANLTTTELLYKKLKCMFGNICSYETR